MINREFRFLALRFTVFTALLAALPCCGLVTRGKNQSLSLNLQVPASENPGDFWFGVTQKSLRVSEATARDGVVVPWQEGQAPDVDIREGDRIEFFGIDDGGRVLVTGEVTAAGEKSLTIPLRRVL